MPDFVTRFAPSPTGRLHLGHAYSALLAFRAAKEAGGRFLLRIEDIDSGRCRPAFEEGIFEDLRWLGLDWETPARRQSDHFDDYAAALATLIDRALVYRCFKTRKEVIDEIARAPHLAATGPEGRQFIGAPLPADEERRRMENGEPFAWRLSLAACRRRLGDAFEALSFTEEGAAAREGAQRITAAPDRFGDVVIARKDAGTSYHLAAVHDDALQGVTHIIRGEDLFQATHINRLLQAILDLPTPAYRHHPLIADDSGKRLAKRDSSVTLKALRENGETRAAILARLGFS